MRNVLMTRGPGVVGSRVIRRLVAAGHEVRTMLTRPTRAVELRATLDIGDVQSSARVSFIAADCDHGARLDAFAGCEFVDDRIRLLE
jgi:dihydroflavonol-4-reductase